LDEEGLEVLAVLLPGPGIALEIGSTGTVLLVGFEEALGGVLPSQPIKHVNENAMTRATETRRDFEDIERTPEEVVKHSVSASLGSSMAQ
jgi:hypothetical protein